ncbi:MAG: OstA-like protein [Bacteroidia bacterium]
MYCDSAYLFRDDNRLEAFNNIRITQGDTLTLTGNLLHYDGNTSFAQVFENVVMTDRKMRLNTSRLDYDMKNDIAFYTDSAHIVDGENVLTSKNGYFYSNSHDLFFRKNVVLTNPKYVMTGDTLRYNTTNQTAYFLGPTYIRSKENLIYCESGWYNTQSQKSNFKQNSYLQTKDQRLKGDSVYYDRIKGIGKVFGNVSITDTTNKISIMGEYGERHEITDSAWVTGNAIMVQEMDGDSMFLHGDTLLAVGKTPADSSSKKDLFAFHHVKIYKHDLQGSCDSLVYRASDSTITLFRNPILWSGLNQLTADSIYMQTENGGISRIYLHTNSFITSLADSVAGHSIEDSLRFNQVKGKDMTGFLNDNKLYRINVNGNGQTIYYAKNKKDKNFAVNRADCSDLVIYVNENKVESISLLNDPDGTLYPIREMSAKELRLKGFKWMNLLRPVSKDDILK